MPRSSRRFALPSQGSIGAQLGGQTFSELFVLDTPAAVERLRAGHFGSAPTSRQSR